MERPVGANVSKCARLRLGSRNICCDGYRARIVKFLIINKEKEMIFPQRTAQAAPKIVVIFFLTRQSKSIIGKCISVKKTVSCFPKGVAVKLICTTLCYEADRGRPLGASISGEIAR